MTRAVPRQSETREPQQRPGLNAKKQKMPAMMVSSGDTVTKIIALLAALAFGLVAGISVMTIRSPQAVADCTGSNC